jgi:hypothetical protein
VLERTSQSMSSENLSLSIWGAFIIETGEVEFTLVVVHFSMKPLLEGRIGTVRLARKAQQSVCF